MKIRKDLQQFFIRLIDPTNEIRQLILLEVLTKCSEAMLHKLVDLDGIVILMRAVDSQANRADESSILAVGVNANEGGVLTMGVAIVGLDELLEALGELLHFYLYRHDLYNFIDTLSLKSK